MTCVVIMHVSEWKQDDLRCTYILLSRRPSFVCPPFTYVRSVLQRLQQQLQNAPEHNGPSSSSSSTKRVTPKRKKKTTAQRTVDAQGQGSGRSNKSAPRSHTRESSVQRPLIVSASTAAAQNSASTSAAGSNGAGSRAYSPPFAAVTSTQGSDNTNGTKDADELERSTRGFDDDMLASAKEDIEDEFVAGAIRSGVALAFSSLPQNGVDTHFPKTRDAAQNGSQEDVERDEMTKLVSALMVPPHIVKDIIHTTAEETSLSDAAVAQIETATVEDVGGNDTQQQQGQPKQRDQQHQGEEDQRGVRSDVIPDTSQTTKHTEPSTRATALPHGVSTSEATSTTTHPKLETPASTAAAATTNGIVRPPPPPPPPPQGAPATTPVNLTSIESSVSLSSLLPLLGLGAQAQQVQQMQHIHQTLVADKAALESRCRELQRVLEQSDSSRRSCQEQRDREISENTKLRSALSLATAEASRLSSRVASIEGEARRSTKAAESTLASAKQRSAKLADEGLQLKSQLTKSTIELGDALKANEELSSTCEELRLGVKNLEAAHALTRGELVSANATSRARAKEIEVLEERVRGLEMELGAMREQLDANAGLEAEAAELGARVSRLVQEKGEQSVAMVRAEREAEEAGTALRGAGMELEAEKARASSLQQRIETMTTIEFELRQEMDAMEKAFQEAGRRERAAEEALLAMNTRFADALQAQKIDRQAMNFDMDAKERCIKETEIALAEARMREKMLLKKIDALEGSRPTANGMGSISDLSAPSSSSSPMAHGSAVCTSARAASGTSLTSFATKFDRELVARLETEEQGVIEALEKEQAALDSLNQFKRSSTPKPSAQKVVGTDGMPSSSLVSSSPLRTSATMDSPSLQQTVPNRGTESSLLDVFGFVPTS